jgi:hypothetical protein
MQNRLYPQHYQNASRTIAFTHKSNLPKQKPYFSLDYQYLINLMMRS